jgi:hypothetical protein
MYGSHPERVRGQRKIDYFLSMRAAVLISCFDSTLPLQLEAIPTKGKSSNNPSVYEHNSFIPSKLIKPKLICHCSL